MRTLGIDTSNYTTSAAVCEDGIIVQNIRLPLPVSPGATGLRQSDTVFHHTKNLPAVLESLDTNMRKLDAIGVSTRPRDAKGSYMPCFLCGETAARILARALASPLYLLSHQANHIRAALYSCKADIGCSFYAYHLSGGTFELLSVEKKRCGYAVEVIGGTKDLTAGQAIDRAGVALGLQFPCGAELERLARENTHTYKKSAVSVSGTYCNLSGLENLTRKMIDDGARREMTASFVLDFVIRTVDTMTSNLFASHPPAPLLFSGGVAANGMLRELMSKKYGALFAEPQYAADNASGSALLAYDMINEKR